MIKLKKVVHVLSIFLFVSAFSILFSENVFAIEYGATEDGKLFSVERKGRLVQSKDLWNISNLKFISGCAKFLPTVIENPNATLPLDKSLCEPGYEFTASYTGKGGRIDFNTGDPIFCPEADPAISAFTVDEVKNTMKIEDIGNFRFRISFSFDTSKFQMRLLKKIDDDTFDTVGDTYTLISGNSFIVEANGVDSYGEFYVEFYSKSGICQGAYLGYVRAFVPNYYANPVLEYTYDDGTKICQKLKDDYNSDVVSTGKVPYCFQNYVGLSEEYPTKEEILAQIAEVEEIKRIANSVTQSDVVRKCSFLSPTTSSNTTTTTSESGEAADKNSYKTTTMGILTETKNNKWFQAQCTEYLELYYDDPKAVNAGAGFSYTSILKIKRVCQPIQIATPRLKPKCSMEPSCWGKHHNGDKGAGPNEAFDTCISSCDGGEYTQECIDSCYQSTYSGDESMNLTYTDKFEERSASLLSYNKKGIIRVYDNRPISNCTPGVTTLSNGQVLASCYVLKSNDGCYNEDGHTYCHLYLGTKVQFENSCNGTDYCYEVFSSSPDCSFDPPKDYYEDLQEAKKELESVNALINSIGNYEDRDEAGNSNKPVIYTGVYDHYTNKQVDLPTYKTVDVSEPTYTGVEERKMAYTTQVDSRGYTVTEEDLKYTFMITEITRTETIELTQAYISRSTNQDGTTGSKYVDVKYDCNDKDKNELVCKDYYDGGNKWYTSLFAPEVNNWSDWPAYNSNQTDYTISNYEENIDVKLQKIGLWNQWNIDVDCIYGLYNNFYKCADGAPLVCNEDDICTCGIQYIFREIDLDDAFPNERDPRWNWQGTINTSNQTTGAARTEDTSLLNYRIDPDSLIDEIESKGETIYDVSTDASEVDYEFVLTRENLRNIRNYNKNVEDFNQDGSNNYLDYDQECYNLTENGKTRKVCTSRFLDNEEYITYSSRSAGYTPEARRKIAVCNNARNLQCYDVTSGS